MAAYKAGMAFCMLPREYGGGGLSNVDLVIAGEELCAVDPGFACTVLVNGLGLMPVWYWGSDEQKDRFLRAATSDPTGEYLVGYAVSEPAGTPGGTANFDTPLPSAAGIGVTARREGEEYVLNGRKYLGKQRRRVHGVLADPRFDPRALMDDEFVPFDKSMETIDTVPGPQQTPQVAPVG